VVWMAAIFTLSSIPSLASPFDPWYDLMLRKLAHVFEYAVLTALLFWALRGHRAPGAGTLAIAALLASLYAFSDEWHQTFVPGREGSLRDVGIDTVGIVLASFWLKSNRRLREDNSSWTRETV
ncbi:MAG TPA: VanZ family protein, partial [Candidatus Binatia bacterium]|nr:VanZ family protein [Candidatus Binatia bacterium]